MKIKTVLLIITCALANSISVSAQSPVESDYTVPSWTLYSRSTPKTQELLIPNTFPYNINTTIHGNPATQMGAAWFTNEGVTEGVLQLLEGLINDTAQFTSSGRTLPASCVAVTGINYNVSGNNLYASAGFTDNLQKNYTSNKVLIDGLKPTTTYSYRVGRKDAWSPTGSFTTAPGNLNEFEFVYIADPQASNDAMFDVSKLTVEKAVETIPTAKFLLCTGDFVDSSGDTNSEWEWEQWFEKMQTTWLKLPIVPVQGNHDTSKKNKNWFNHFNTDTTYNTIQTNINAKTAMNGTVYSFVYGDALFMAVNYEDFSSGETYFAALEKWMEQQISANPTVKWRIAVYHKTLFTGSSMHQDNSDGKIVRERMAGVYDRLGIDLALQGHDHVYEVIGVLNSTGNAFSMIQGAVTSQQTVTPIIRENVTGLEGGTFNVTNGTLYVLNNSAGMKKYEPRSQVQMDNAIASHGVNNYFSLFNKFGQTGDPTFSHVTVSTSRIQIDTYTVSNSGNTTLFDAITLVKNQNGTEVEKIQTEELVTFPNPANDYISIRSPEEILQVEVYTVNGNSLLKQTEKRIELDSFTDGIYILQVRTKEKVYTKRFLVKK